MKLERIDIKLDDEVLLLLIKGGCSMTLIKIDGKEYAICING